MIIPSVFHSVGQVYTLETYKSLEEKLSLLDAAIRSRDGNAVTAVAVFFQNSVKNNIFLTQMKRRPAAIDHYLQVGADIRLGSRRGVAGSL